MTGSNAILTAIFAVFTAVAEWITSAVTNILPMFYTAEAGLSFLGVLSVSGLAFSVVFLIFYCMVRLNSNVDEKYHVNCGNPLRA